MSEAQKEYVSYLSARLGQEVEIIDENGEILPHFLLLLPKQRMIKLDDMQKYAVYTLGKIKSTDKELVLPATRLNFIFNERVRDVVDLVYFRLPEKDKPIMIPLEYDLLMDSVYVVGKIKQSQAIYKVKFKRL